MIEKTFFLDRARSLPSGELAHGLALAAAAEVGGMVRPFHRLEGWLQAAERPVQQHLEVVVGDSECAGERDDEEEPLERTSQLDAASCSLYWSIAAPRVGGSRSGGSVGGGSNGGNAAVVVVTVAFGKVG